ncbi:hypothetical protein [Streptomyces graminofaciens]|nr:hypothetical protein [Streptomyces graminofaciens]
MDLADVLDGLDDRPWAALQHAYGSAEDVPDGLRAVAGDDTEAAKEALYEFYGNIWHQGTVYAATVEAVPFLARLAAAGCHSAELLGLLGSIAESEDAHGVAPGACRAAVVAQLPLLLPLLAAEDAQVRQAAAWAIGHTGAQAEAWPGLERRWAEERGGVVRAELLAAMVRLDPAASAKAATGALDPAGPAELRVAGVLACLDAGLPWGVAHHDAVLSVLPADELVSERFDEEQREPLRAVVDALLRRDTDEDREAAFRLLDAALGREDPQVRGEAVWAADHACLVSRAAPARLVPALVPLLDDPLSASSVLSLLGKVAEQVGRAVVPSLVRLAGGGGDGGRDRDREGDEDGGDTADLALALLVTVAPERAAELLAAELPRRPRALAVAAGARGPGENTNEVALPFSPALLDAARRRLADPAVTGNEPIHLALLLALWGGRAAAAVPQLLDALPRIPLVGPKALVALCPTEGAVRERVENGLREAALRGPGDGRLASARALHELTGDVRPLLDAIRNKVAGGGYGVREAAQVAAGLTPATGVGPAAAELVPALRGALSDPAQQRNMPQLDGDVELAGALWRLTGDTTEAVRVLEGVLAEAGGAWFRWTGVRAARLAARLGSTARPLRPALEGMLTDPLHAPAATLALLAALPEEELRGQLNRTALADLVLASAEDGTDPDAAFEALTALGTRALTTEQRHRLAALADRDPRVVDSGLEDQIIRKDERLRTRARTVLADLGGRDAG